MKKSLSFILAVTMILSVIVPASLFASAAETVLLNFDSSASGYTVAFNTTYATDTTQKTEGSASMRMGFSKPAGQSGSIGGMLHYEYPSAQDFSSYKTLSLDVYLPVKANGSSALQVNFITETGTNWDGFNVLLGLDGRDAGWHTFSITRVSQPPAISSAKWTSISRLRFTWFNYSGDTTTTYFLLDNLRGVSAGGSSSSSTTSSDSSSTTSTPSNPNEAAAPYKSGNDLIINDGESTNGWKSEFNATISASSNCTEGSSAVSIASTIPKGQNANIGAMAFLNIPTTDLSGYKYIALDLHISETVAGGNQFQINFCSDDTGNDGLNYIFGIGDKTPGWHSFLINTSDLSASVAGNSWNNITRIRMTWFNVAQVDTKAVFTVDNFRLTNESASSVPDSSDTESSTPVSNDPNYGHSAYVDDGDLMVHNADSTYGWKGYYATTIEGTTTLKTQGTGAVTMKPSKPTGQPGNFGAMGKLAIPKGNFTGYTNITFDLYISENLSGSHGFQVNFISEGSDDGFNYMKPLDNFTKGWYRVSFKVSQPTATATDKNPSWSNINYIRFSWVNNAQQNVKVNFTVDNLRLNLGHTTYTEGDSTMLHNFDKLVGLMGEVGTNIDVVKSNDNEIVKQGSGSLKVTPNGTTDRADKISARFVVSFDSKAVLTDGKRFSLKMYTPVKLAGSHTLHIAFVSDTSGYSGFNFNYDLNDAEAGWHTIEMGVEDYSDKDSSPRLRWANINRIVVTWLNNAGMANSQPFYFDDFRMINVDDTVSSDAPSSTVDPSSVVEPSSEPEPSEEPSGEPSSEDESSASAPDFTYGDIDENGEITSADALLVLQYSVQKVQFTERQKMVADVAKPLSVNSSDALAILQYSVKKITEFDPPARPVTPESSETVSSEIVPDTSSETPPVSSTTSTPDFDIPDSVINNGAYAKDTTADLSFSITTEGLQPKTIYLVTSAVPDTSTDHARLVYSLQGLINRDFGLTHNTLIYMNGVDPSDLTWYQKMTAAGAAFEGYGRKVIRTFDDFYTAFEPQIKQCGYILWDPNVPATSNVAGTICGLDGYLPVCSGSALQTYLNSKGVSQKQSLVGQFNGSVTGSAKNDAYRWALTNYFSRCSATYVGYILDAAPTLAGSPYNHNYVSLPNHDYLIARRAFMFDLDPYAGEVACDAGGGKVGLDNETMLMILQERYNRANGEFGQLLGYTPWWCKYASDGDTGYAGNSGNHGAKQAVFLEWLLCEYLGCYNIAKEADAAHPCEMSNGSAFYKYPITQKITNNHTAQTTSFNPNVYYFTIYVGDYDSSAWLKKYTAQFWIGDSARGTLPLMWAFNPNLVYRSPVLFDFINKNKTSNDYLVAGEGAGYIIPHGVFQGKRMSYSGVSRPAGNGDASQKWADYNKYFYKLCDMDITGFILNGANSIDGDIFNCYSQFNTIGAFHMDSNLKFVHRNNVPYVVLNISCPDSAGMYSYATGTMGSYRFSCFRTVSESPTQIKERVNGLISYGAGRGVTFQYVDPYSFFNLAKQSGRLSAR